jgi:hypothetical protein
VWHVRRLQSRAEAWAGVPKTYPHTAHAADEAGPGTDHEASARRAIGIRWGQGAVEVVAIGAIPADGWDAAGVADEGSGGADG